VPDTLKLADRPEAQTPFEVFVKTEAASGLLLFLAALAALALANSPGSTSYFALRHFEISLSAGAWMAHATLQHIVNDGLMAIFFLVVGLEIKREMLAGELASVKNAILPFAGALGGMLFPALLFVIFNLGRETLSGWAIPMATDIAFALGVLSLFGSRVPASAKLFLTSLAIIDDLAAIIVITVAYSGHVVLTNLACSAALLGLLFVLNRLGVKAIWPYLVGGFGVWAFLFGSGVHATIAGVAVAGTIPVLSKIDPEKFQRIGTVKLRRIGEATAHTLTPLIDGEQEQAIKELESVVRQVQPPLITIQHLLHPWSTFLIMPAFAFFNAGIALNETPFALNAMTVGIIVGLVIGKPAGVILACWLAVRMRWTAPLVGVTRMQWGGIAMLTGIGFTMSLFIASLAFDSQSLVDTATTSILIASLVAMSAGALLLLLGSRKASVRKDPVIHQIVHR